MKFYCPRNQSPHHFIFDGSNRLAAVKIPCDFNRLSNKTVYIAANNFYSMKTFIKLRSIKIIRPEFLSFRPYRIFLVAIKNQIHIFNAVIINTSSYNIQVADNPHSRMRVSYSANRQVRIRIKINIERTFKSNIIAQIYSLDHNVIFSGFSAVQIKRILPAF